MDFITLSNKMDLQKLIVFINFFRSFLRNLTTKLTLITNFLSKKSFKNKHNIEKCGALNIQKLLNLFENIGKENKTYFPNIIKTCVYIRMPLIKELAPY